VPSLSMCLLCRCAFGVDVPSVSVCLLCRCAFCRIGSLVEESDFKATKELFGGKDKEKSLDDFIPKSGS